MKKRKFTSVELNDPKNRAQFIHQMPLSMKLEVLGMIEDMSQGGDGGSAYDNSNKKNVTVRTQHYSVYSNSWFQDVLKEYNLINGDKNESR